MIQALTKFTLHAVIVFRLPITAHSWTRGRLLDTIRLKGVILSV
jgi:hypothetical protein